MEGQSSRTLDPFTFRNNPGLFFLLEWPFTNPTDAGLGGIMNRETMGKPVPNQAQLQPHVSLTQLHSCQLTRQALPVSLLSFPHGLCAWAVSPRGGLWTLIWNHGGWCFW